MPAISRKFGAQFAANLSKTPLASAPFLKYLRKEFLRVFAELGLVVLKSNKSHNKIQKQVRPQKVLVRVIW